MASNSGSESMLTTVDNPFDPFDQFDEWYAWDTAHGYNTLNLLARVTRSSPDHSEADAALAEEDAIDEVIRFNASGMHRKVQRNSDSD